MLVVVYINPINEIYIKCVFNNYKEFGLNCFNPTVLQLSHIHLSQMN